jgi:hypothetical protein
VDGNEGKAGGDGEGATEMEALRAFAESVGGGHDLNVGFTDGIMDSLDGVVTECAGGAIEEIHWNDGMHYPLFGTLPVGDLNMPKLRVLDLSHTGVKGERESERVG